MIGWQRIPIHVFSGVNFNFLFPPSLSLSLLHSPLPPTLATCTVPRYGMYTHLYTQFLWLFRSLVFIGSRVFNFFFFSPSFLFPFFFLETENLKDVNLDCPSLFQCSLPPPSDLQFYMYHIRRWSESFDPPASKDPLLLAINFKQRIRYLYSPMQRVSRYRQYGLIDLVPWVTSGSPNVAPCTGISRAGIRV